MKLTVEGVEGGALFSRYLAGDYDLAMPLVQWTSDVTVPDETGLQIWTNDKANVFRAAEPAGRFRSSLSRSPNRRHARKATLLERISGSECSAWRWHRHRGSRSSPCPPSRLLPTTCKGSGRFRRHGGSRECLAEEIGTMNARVLGVKAALWDQRVPHRAASALTTSLIGLAGSASQRVQGRPHVRGGMASSTA